MHYCTLWNSALINTTVSIHPECLSHEQLINKTEAPAAHNPCMVSGAEVKTPLYAKIRKPQRALDEPLGRQSMGPRFCPIRHRWATGGHSLSL